MIQKIKHDMSIKTLLNCLWKMQAVFFILIKSLFSEWLTEKNLSTLSVCSFFCRFPVAEWTAVVNLKFWSNCKKKSAPSRWNVWLMPSTKCFTHMASVIAARWNPYLSQFSRRSVRMKIMTVNYSGSIFEPHVSLIQKRLA